MKRHKRHPVAALVLANALALALLVLPTNVLTSQVYGAPTDSCTRHNVGAVWCSSCQAISPPPDQVYQQLRWVCTADDDGYEWTLEDSYWGYDDNCGAICEGVDGEEEN